MVSMSSPLHHEQPGSSSFNPDSGPPRGTHLPRSPPAPTRQGHASSPSESLSTPPSRRNRPPNNTPTQQSADPNTRRPQNSSISNNEGQSTPSNSSLQPTAARPRTATSESSAARHQAEFDDHFQQQEQDDLQFVQDFWKIYDDLLFLSLFTQLGVVARLASSTWFTYFDSVFTTESALFVNLPLNCLSCWLLGLLSSGDSCLQLVLTRFSPPRLQQQHHKEELADTEDPRDSRGHNDDDLHEDRAFAGNASPHRRTRSFSNDSQDFDVSMGGRGVRNQPRRRGKRDKQNKFFRYWQPPVNLNDELRDVQLLALERRIRQSKCLVLFPVSKEDVDVMEHYFDEGFKKNHTEVSEGSDAGNGSQIEEHHEEDDIEGQEAITSYSHDLAFEESIDPTDAHQPTLSRQAPVETIDHDTGRPDTDRNVDLHGEDNQIDINQIVNDVSANVTENVTRLRRANIADGWDVGTTGADMADDIMLGLRFGFCGALSSFSSWNSAMINLIRSGKIGDAFVGYMLGLQLPIIDYRFGQHVAVYIFVWRCRRETKRDERRGYGIQLNTQEDEDEGREMRRIDNSGIRSGSLELSPLPTREEEGDEHLASQRPPNMESVTRNKDPVERQSPSIRAVVTVIFIMAVVTQCTSISFYNEPQNQVVAMSLLFSPLGVLARWRLSKYNAWRPTFPIGTFTCNILACALSGGLGRIMAGNPNEEERLVLVSVINGFGGTLSSVANFIVEILAGIDPILFRVDGAVYALWSIGCAMLVGFLFTASADWADALG